MSLAAAQAMDDLAHCLDVEAEGLPAGSGFQVMAAMARAHRAAATMIRARAQREMGGAPPPEFEAGQAGTKKGGR